jgi:hypothetical protein
MNSLVFITGPSGAGKSATAAKVAELWPSTCVLLDFDEQRTRIKSGYAEPAYGWNDECERQWALSRDAIGALVPVYAARGVTVVVEGYANTGDYDLWLKAFGTASPRTYVLLPPLATVIERNNLRRGAARLKESDVVSNHEWSAAWRDQPGVTIFDNAGENPEQTARRIVANPSFDGTLR